MQYLIGGKKVKKILLVLILVIVVSLFAFPATLYAEPIEDLQLTAKCSDNPSETRCWVVTNPNNSSVKFYHWARRKHTFYGESWLTIPANSSMKICLPFNHANGEIEVLRLGWNDAIVPPPMNHWSPDVATIDDKCLSPAPAWVPPVWVRTMPMTCWQVWINEDNNFQFIFWYLYKDNNWVRIYDMEDNLVHETDLSINDPNLIVDLPDGFYMVKTFHHDELLQEFLIGKP